jgi:hypothetical protein
MKILSWTILFCITLMTAIISIAYQKQKSFHDTFGPNYNNERLKKRIPTIDSFENVEYTTWDNYYDNNKIKKWLNILTNQEFTNASYYYNPELNNAIYHESKSIFYVTKTFFWQNELIGEMDLFVNSKDSIATYELVIAYIQEKNKDYYFFANIDTTTSDRPLIFKCGTDSMDRVREVGNITKLEADNILAEWGIK